MKVLIDGHINAICTIIDGRCISCLMTQTGGYVEQHVSREDWFKISLCVEDLYNGKKVAVHEPWSVEL